MLNECASPAPSIPAQTHIQSNCHLVPLKNISLHQLLFVKPQAAPGLKHTVVLRLACGMLGKDVYFKKE